MPPPEPPSRARAFERQRRREAAAERGGVGHQVRLVEALAVGREEVRPVVAAAGERIERGGLTGGDAGPGQVAGVDVGLGAGVVEPVAHFTVEVHVADQRAVGGVRGEVEAEVGAGRPAGGVTIEGGVLLRVAAGDENPLRGRAAGATSVGAKWRPTLAAKADRAQIARVGRARSRSRPCRTRAWLYWVVRLPPSNWAVM